MRRPTEAQYLDQLAEASATIARLERDGLVLLDRAAAGARDGYPTTSGISGSARASGVPDPTGELATAAPGADPLRALAARMCSAVTEALAALRSADGARAEAFPPDKVPAGPPGSGECGACGRYCPGGPDRLRSGYCSGCYRAWLRTDDGNGRMERAAFARQRSEDDLHRREREMAERARTKR